VVTLWEGVLALPLIGTLDSARTQIVMENLLQRIVAESGKEGVRQAVSIKPDVILLDFRLTDMTGADVYRQLREHPDTARVPIVVVTSHTLSASDRDDFGHAPVLSKSALTRDALKTAIRDAGLGVAH
jgi:CheY-like chemotaxis protein